jgi:two-component system, OmpR family, response regulator RegX3
MTTDSIVAISPYRPFLDKLSQQLVLNGYTVQVATDAAQGLRLAEHALPSAILLDRSIEALEAVRRSARLKRVPILMVLTPGSACTDEDCVEDLQRGADATVCRHGERELIARLRAILRRERAPLASPTQYRVGELSLDTDRHEVCIKGRPIELTPKEFKILHQLLLHPSKVFTRDELLDRVWGEGAGLEEQTLNVHIHSLRHKIEPDPDRPRYIVTVRGVGYKLKHP